MIAQHMGGLPSAYPPIATTSASGPSANAPGATRLVERRHRAVAGEVALYAQCVAPAPADTRLCLSQPSRRGVGNVELRRPSKDARSQHSAICLQGTRPLASDGSDGACLRCKAGNCYQSFLYRLTQSFGTTLNPEISWRRYPNLPLLFYIPRTCLWLEQVLVDVHIPSRTTPRKNIEDPRV